LTIARFLSATGDKGKLRQVCPKLIVIRGDFSKYEHFSRMMFSYAYDFTPEVEVGSIDEGYFDLRSQKKKPAREIADTIRVAVAQSLKLSACRSARL
jgi:nucleotidyltransferase/DNA polymerase involved in DNA repair